MDRRLGMTMDALEPRGLGAFWAFALGYVEEPPPDGFDDWDSALAAWGVPEERRADFYAVVDPTGEGPRLFFQRVPESKSAKNRLHLDVGVPGLGRGEVTDERRETIRAHVTALTARGATAVTEVDDPMEGFWVVMQDPEGNEFCVT